MTTEVRLYRTDFIGKLANCDSITLNGIINMTHI